MNDIQNKTIRNTISLNKEQLLEFLRLAQYASDKKSPVIFEIAQDYIICKICDPLIEIKYTIPLNNNINTKRIIGMNALKLYEFVRKLDTRSDEISLHINESTVLIEHNLGKGTISITETPDIHTFEQKNLPAEYTLDAKNFVENLRTLKTSISTDLSREQFSGLNVQYNGKLELWATDGHILCMSIMSVHNAVENSSSIWPKRFIECISSITPSDKCSVRIHKTHAEYQQKGVVIITPLINAHILPVHKLFDKENPYTLQIDIDANEFIKQVERVTIFSDESKMFSISYKNGVGKLLSIGNTGDSGDEIIKGAEYSANKDEVEIVIGASQALSILKNFKTQTLIQYYENKGNILIKKKSGGYPIYIAAVRR